MSIMDQVNYTLQFHSSNLVSQDNYTRFLELLKFKQNLERELSSLGNSSKKIKVLRVDKLCDECMDEYNKFFIGDE